MPENLALGVSLLSGGGSIVLLVAIFCSNFPEALAGAVAMRRGGRSAFFAVGIWTLAAVLLTLAVLFGRAVFAQFSEESLAFPLAFAGGAVLASLADTLMPEAFEHGPSAKLHGNGGRVPALVYLERMIVEEEKRAARDRD